MPSADAPDIKTGERLTLDQRRRAVATLRRRESIASTRHECSASQCARQDEMKCPIERMRWIVVVVVVVVVVVEVVVGGGW